MAPGVSCRPIVLILTTFCLPVLVHVAAAAQAVPDVTFVTACEGDPGGENVTLGSTSFIFLDGDKLGNHSYCYCNFSSRDVINVSTHRARGIYAFGADSGGSGTDYRNCLFADRCRWNDSDIQLQLNPCHGQGGTYILLKVQGAENSSVNVTCTENTKTVERCTAATSATASSSTAPSSVPLATTALSASAGTSWTTTALSASAGTSRTTTPESDATATNSEIVTAEQKSSRDLNATHGQDSRAASPSAVPGPSTPANTSASPGSLGAGESQTADVNRPNMTSTVVLGVGAGLIALAIVIVVVVVLTNRRRRAGADPQGETKQPQPGKGGRSRFRPPGPSQPDPGTAALHSSRASLISELHDYEDVSEDGLSQAQQQQQQQQRDAPPSRKVSKDSARLDAAAPMPGRDVYSHFSPSGSANGPNYTNVSIIPASATTPTKDRAGDSDYNKLDLRPAPRQSGPSGKVAAKALTLPKTSAPAADQGSRVYGQSDECARSPTAHSGEGDIYENVDDRRENSSGSRRRKPRKGEEKEKGGGAEGEVAEDMYQDCMSSKGGNRSLPRLGVMSGGGDSFRLSPRLSRAGSWRLSWRRRNHGKSGQHDKALADLDVRHLPLPRDPCGTDDDDNPYEIEDGPFGRPLPPRLPPSVSRATNLRRNSSRSMDNVSRAVLLKVARDATRRLGLNRPKSMDLSQLELMPDSARSSFHSSRSQGDGAETLPRVINDLNDEDQYEEIPGLCPPIPAKFSVPGSRPLGANTTLSPPSHSLSVPAADPVPQATSSRPGPARRTSPRSRTSSEPPKASPRPERAATRPRVQAPEAGEAEVVLRRSSKAVSPTKVKVDKPPLPQDGKFTAEDQLKLLRINVLELQTAVRKSMEIHEDELLMVDNVLYATLPRNSSQPTTEL